MRCPCLPFSNRKRDCQINKKLKQLGWRVIGFWESSLPDEEAGITKLKLLIERVMRAMA